METLEEKLIELVRVYPVLYDTSDCNYMKSKYKQEIWGKIAKELNTSDVEGIKSTWKKLRNSHRDALRRQKRMVKSGAAAMDVKPWRLQFQMEFLLKYMVNENRETSLTDDFSDQHQRGLENQQAEEVINDENDISVLSDGISQPDTPEVDSAYVNESTKSLPPTPRPHKKFKKHEVDTLLVKAIEKREQRATERERERKKVNDRIDPSDDLHLFYMSMYELTKKMPHSSQHIVRRNVFLSVSDEEARLLNIIREPAYSQESHNLVQHQIYEDDHHSYRKDKEERLLNINKEPAYSPRESMNITRQPVYDDQRRTYRNWSGPSSSISSGTSSSSAGADQTSMSSSLEETVNTNFPPSSSMATFLNTYGS